MSRHPERRRPERRHPELGRNRASAPATAGLFLIAAIAITACTPAGIPAKSASPSDTAGPTATATPTPTVDPGPMLVPDGSAEDNLPLFTEITNAVWATPDNVTGRAYIDALVAAGFDKAAMQVTYDQTTVGNAAESIQFAVRWQEECLVGQVGPATGAPVTVVVPGLSEGRCLVGSTRPIDW